MEAQNHDYYLDGGLRALRRTGCAEAFVQDAKRTANASVLQRYQSPLALVRLVTQLPWQQPSDVPVTFLEELTSESEPGSALARHGWSLNGAAVRQDAPGELALDLLKCSFAMDDAYGPDERQAIAQKRDSEAAQQDTPASAGPEVQATSSNRSAFRYSRPTSATMPATSPNIILHTCTTPGAVKAYRSFMNGGMSSPGTDANAPFCPSMLMSTLHQASHSSARKGQQVLLQEETDLYLMQHKGAKEPAPGSSPFSNSCEQPAWSHTLLDPSVPLPGLLNLATQPNIVGVAPRCVASNGLSPIKLSLYGMYIQGGKITARCAGRYLHTSWRTHQSGRVTSRVQLARWHRKRSNCSDDNEDKDEADLNMEMESEVVILDPPASGLIALECRQGYLVSKPAFLLIVPATHNLSRELTSGLACPPASLGLISRSSTQKDISRSLGTDDEVGEGAADGPILSDEEAKERMLTQVRCQQKDRHIEVVKDSIARDMGSFFQFMHLMRRQMGLESRLDLPPASSNKLTPMLSASGNLSSGSSRNPPSGLQPMQTRDTTRTTRRSSLGADAVALQPTPQSSAGTGGLRALVPGKNSGLNSVRLPSLHETSTPSVDLTPQLSLVAAKSNVHLANMVSLGVRLLQLACEMAWPYTARTILTGLMDMGLNFHDIEAQAAQDGLSFLHRAVRSRNAGMVAEVGMWAAAASRTLDWGVADADGVTPLHMAACLEDGGLLGIHILRKWPAAGELWLTKETYRDKLTPKHMAEAAGNEFLNRMADMAGLLNCQSCSDMACAVRTPLPGQALTNLPMGAPAPAESPKLEEPEAGSPTRASSGNTAWVSTDTVHHLSPSLSAALPSVEQLDTRAFLRLPTVPERESAERSGGSIPLDAGGVDLSAASGTPRASMLPMEKSRPSPAWSEGARDGAGTVHTQGSSSADVLPTAAVPGAAHHALHAQGPSSHSAVPSAHPLVEKQQQPHSFKLSGSGSSGSSVQLQAASKPIGVKPLREACCGDESSVSPAERPVVEADSSPPTRPKKKMGLCGLF